MTPALGEPRDRGDWDYFFACNVPREMLGLKSGRQPGDVDILVVPVREGRVFPEFAGAIEVKRLALKGPNWTKNVDRYGIRQATGLLRDGFPFVGLLHLIVNLEGPAEFSRLLGVARVIDERGTIEILDDEIADLTGFLATERQYRRLFAQNPDSVLGINCVAIGEIEYEPQEASAYTTLTPGRHAMANPRVNTQLVRNIGCFAEAGRRHSELRSYDRRNAEVGGR